MTGFSETGDARRLPCGCWAVRVGEHVVIDAEAFLCTERHRQGLSLTLADVASLAVAAALEETSA